MPTLAFTVLVPNGNGYLFRFERLTEREDAQFLQSKVEAVVSDLKTLGLAFFFFEVLSHGPLEGLEKYFERFPKEFTKDFK